MEKRQWVSKNQQAAAAMDIEENTEKYLNDPISNNLHQNNTESSIIEEVKKMRNKAERNTHIQQVVEATIRLVSKVGIFY